MKKILNNVIILCSVALISSCATKKGNLTTNDTDLFSNKWQVIQIGSETIKPEVNGTVPYLMFNKEDNRYSVKTGCNTINGEIKINKNDIKFGLGMSTMMFCDDMSVENGFKTNLDKITSFQIEGNELKLMNNSTTIAKLKKNNELK